MAKFTQRLTLAARAAAAALSKGEIPPSLLTRPVRDIPPISSEEVTEARSFFPMDKFFIYGHARSGTTLLTRLVRVHPAIHCNYQGHFFTRPPLLQGLVADPEVGAWLVRRSNRWNRGRDLSPVVLRAVSDYIMERDARAVGKTIVGDKSPNSLLDGEAVRLLHKVYPDGRLIFIVRDGRDAAISHRFQAFIDIQHSLSSEDLHIRQEFAREPEPFLNGQRSIFTEKGLRLAAQSWVHNVVETDRAAQELYPGMYHSLRYEDLLRSSQVEMCKVWDFLLGKASVNDEIATVETLQALDQELQRNPDADWQVQKAGEIALAVQKGKSGSWRNLMTPKDQQLFYEIAGGALDAWGFQ